ncbi:B12-binding domain-containing radical SAM protein [Saccharicrinis aurantiacus]|uniref:B12-binding domain-containing radical SAM protein n=1 Tax=Saccharicrinis aurantiacus TaxID=1849719 RepID=UPI00094FE84D|nr:radical SAM protein [Saccharicrinis aurantiacus]
MQAKTLLITPPFTQLNTPYPATTYLKGYLNKIGKLCSQVDLGIDLILQIFSAEKLESLFNIASNKEQSYTANTNRIIALQDDYIGCIDAVIQFLQGKNNTLAHTICSRNFLPEASRFNTQEDIEWAFGAMGIIDKAKHLSTLFLEDLSDFIIEAIDPHFGFSRYAERISSAAASFDPIYDELISDNTPIISLQLEILQSIIEREKPQLIGFSIPFPGNLFSALKCSQFIKTHYPEIKISIGGGYPNTELRQIQDIRLFEFIDFITLDDGEAPLINLIEHIEGNRPINQLKRTLILKGKSIEYIDASDTKDISQREAITPCYEGLSIKDYLSVIEITNPMHSLWSDGRWNKLTMAHGCYWGRCTFCDTTLDYIKRFEPSTAKVLCDRMEEMIKQTGETGFHFTDEAAPPALMIALAQEIIKRKLSVTWWTNVRFESSFTEDVCKLLKASGCIAVSGGMEVASDRILSLINKGVSVSKVAVVCNNFTLSGIMVHTYLMYGFPTQTEQETIDSLEIVRQCFEANIVQSGFWHQFAMTCHSPVGKNPDRFMVSIDQEETNSFANNDLYHTDPEGAKHKMFSEGLKKSLFNYMHDVGFDLPLQEWFDFKVPNASISKDYIYSSIENYEGEELSPNKKIIWLGGKCTANRYNKKNKKGKNITLLKLSIFTKKETLIFSVNEKLGQWIIQLIDELLLGKKITFGEFEDSYINKEIGDFDLFWESEAFEKLREAGLLII